MAARRRSSAKTASAFVAPGARSRRRPGGGVFEDLRIGRALLGRLVVGGAAALVFHFAAVEAHGNPGGEIAMADGRRSRPEVNNESVPEKCAISLGLLDALSAAVFPWRGRRQLRSARRAIGLSFLVCRPSLRLI